VDYSRTGIKERRILKDTDKGTFLAIKAAQDLIAKAIDPLEIDIDIGNSYTRYACSFNGVCSYTIMLQMLLLMICKRVLALYGMSTAAPTAIGRKI
jgi:3-oxoacyl-[acyl-carrier-protein] synthase III